MSWVRDVVALGRLPYQRSFAAGSAADCRIVDQALDQVRGIDLADRMFAELSGGERQRVLMAHALAQRTELLSLDEPTNHLDIRHQLELLELLRSLGVTTLVAMHGLNLAAGYAARFHVLDAGRLVASGPPAEVEAFGLRVPALISGVVLLVLAVCYGVASHPDRHLLQVSAARGRTAPFPQP